MLVTGICYAPHGDDDRDDEEDDGADDGGDVQRVRETLLTGLHSEVRSLLEAGAMRSIPCMAVRWPG